MAEEKLCGITIIDDTEELEFQPYPKTKPEVKIVYRRVPDQEQAKIRSDYTKDDRSGDIDAEGLSMEILRRGLLRFEHVYAKPGQVAPCTPEIMRKLDPWITERMLLLICGRVAGYVHVPLLTPVSSQSFK